jgi:hypothetical protein
VRGVGFSADGAAATRVLGLPVDGPLTRAPELDVLAQVSISDPTEGRLVDGRFSARGRAASYQREVRWTLRDRYANVVRAGTARTEGTDEVSGLEPWSTGEIDVADLAAGRYTLTATVTDPLHPRGSVAPGSVTDTRTVVLE